MISNLLRLLVRHKIIVGVACLTLLGVAVFAQNRDDDFDVSYVAVTGNIVAAQRAEVYSELLAHRNNIAGIDDIKQILDRVSWIRQVDVMRRWPNRITVTVIPESPIAVWNSNAFLDDRGVVFRSPFLSGAGLARLDGPTGSEDEVMEQYQQLAKALGRLGRSIGTLKLDERGAWDFTTEGGIRVMLGKDDIMDRFQRFLLVLDSKQLAPRVADVSRIDTRYSNGVAVSWKKTPTGLKVAKTDNY